MGEPGRNSRAGARTATEVSNVVLRSASRGWLGGAISVLTVLGLLLLIVITNDLVGTLIGAACLVTAALLALCLRIEIRIEGGILVVRNGLRTKRVPLSSISGTRSSVGPNIGLLSAAWYWALRRRTFWLTSEQGSDVRVAVFMEVRSDGEWRSIGTASADEWWQLAVAARRPSTEVP